MHESAHREAIDRRRRDDRHLPHPGQGHLQGARDGGSRSASARGRRRAAASGAPSVADAEMLLLVDDHEAQLAKLDRSWRASAWVPTTMSTVPSARPVLDRRSPALVVTRRESCSTRTGRPLEALLEQLEVLAGQQRRGHHDRDLLAGHRGQEGRPQRHLGLAEADIAADQRVHGLARGRSSARPRWRVQLVVGLREGEAGGELVIGAFPSEPADRPSARPVRRRS
jgi:hypothetical protein